LTVEIHKRRAEYMWQLVWVGKAYRKQKAYTRGEKIYIHSFSDPTLSSTLAINLKQNAQSATVTWKQAWSQC